MSLRTELLKSVWYAFTSLDTEKSGKVSKSQLKVLSHNLYTVFNIPHDPVALEDHFRDDDDGPVSSQGYMPYLNQYILDKVVEGTFVKESFHELCWTLTAKKNYRPTGVALPNQDAFHLWCLFNYLSEDTYPLIMVPDEVQYLLQKLFTITRSEMGEMELGEVLSLEHGVSVWQFLDLVTSPKILRSISMETLSMAIQDIYKEIIQDVLKQVLPDRDGRRCMFCVKTATKTYEISASDTKHRQEWVTAIQTGIRLQQSGSASLHRELQSKRREQREQRELRRVAREQELQRLTELKSEKERQHRELEQLRESQKKAEEAMMQEKLKHQEQQEELQRLLTGQLREAEEARVSMQAEMQQKEMEAIRQKERIQELEQLQDRLKEALSQEIKARQDEEEYRHAQAKFPYRLLIQEEDKLRALLRMQEEQTHFVEKAQMEKQVLQQGMELKNKELQEAQRQLEDVRENRQKADRDVQVAQRKLHQASTNVRHWNIQMNRLMHPISPGDKRVAPTGGFQGLQGSFLTRRDSSLKRLQTEGKECPQSIGDHLENSVNQ
ncbi:differentially expressed in FDCP 6 homolog isoform X3 [Engystomops pustulosus]|uniref:differentially expressed in FDCP 6 homolog isoform X3 n=1 Tax=Engystomops pustulosus TaxID=76066 RepID=UPI003AFB2CC6